MIRLTAIETAFYQGSLVRPGQTFDFDDSNGARLPKWAVREGTPMQPKPAGEPGQRPLPTMADMERHAAQMRAAGVHDCKPLEAQLAAHIKNGTRPIEPAETRGFF